jgi:hypothetical protein
MTDINAVNFGEAMGTPEVRCLLKRLRQQLIEKADWNKTYGIHMRRKLDNIKTHHKKYKMCMCTKFIWLNVGSSDMIL